MIIEKAKLFTTACEAGLILAGQDEDKQPEWIGDRKAWTNYENLAMGDEMEKLSALKSF